MTSWNPSLSLASPAAFGPLASGSASLGSTADSVLSAANTAATAASVFYSQQLDPAAVAAQALIQQFRQTVEDSFASGGYKLAVHPFVPGVGTGSGVFKSLSFPNCIRVICKEFDDAGDKLRPVFGSATTVELIAIVAGAPSPSLFVSTLQALNSLLSLSEFRLALRRMEQALKLDQVRFIRKQGSRLPDWSSWQLRDIQPAKMLEQALLTNLSLVDGYARAADSIFDTAAALIAKKQLQLQRLQQTLDDAMALFSGGLVNAGIYTLYASAQGTQGVKTALKNATGGAGHELSFTAGIAIVAASPALTLLKEMLAL